MPIIDPTPQAPTAVSRLRMSFPQAINADEDHFGSLDGVR
jgi:hypothetical protein